MKVVICDDYQLMLEQVENIVRQFEKTECLKIDIELYESGKHLLFALKDNEYFDLFLLDIEMPEVNGMDLAREIHEKYPAAKIIFITSYLKYAVSAYEYAVFRYIPKEEVTEKLPQALADYIKLYRLQENEFYTIQVKSRVEKLQHKDILYILKEGKYAVFHLKNGGTASVRKSLSLVFEELNQQSFNFIDRGCIVNLSNIKRIDGKRIFFIDEQPLLISKSGAVRLKSELLHFWEKQL